ncbi:PadR family transcriptional regulator [Halapricum hydrolyticum]|uniref:PadR family transcriptional regulator n=1 Tax=Halapricum hydrolyticum TaxID=2979991 RepID=A0ABT2Q0T0_9EURY|nr:PadR family transcriptional regulator [Halapricum hydrolyticum]MCU4717478.1 PadR family transcriptional regulator [Halapricum hydrolyticum]
MKWLQSGRRRDLCVLLYGEDGVPAQKLKTALERRYGERIDPKQFYGAMEALERLGHVRSRTEGLSDVYELTDAGREHVEVYAAWLDDEVGCEDTESSR